MTRRKKLPARAITNDRDAKRLIAYLEASSRHGKRNAMIMEIAICTGYRMGDLVGLTVAEIKEFLYREEFIILENKKKNTKNIRKDNIKSRRVPIPRKLRLRLKDYIKDKKDYEYMFPSNKVTKGHVTVDTISKVFKSAGEKLGIYGVTAHSGRKTYATLLYENSGYDLLFVKENLGHSSIEVTKVYLDLNKHKSNNYLECIDNFI